MVNLKNRLRATRTYKKYGIGNMMSSDVERITVKSSVEAGMSSGHGSSKRDSLDAGKSGRVN